MTDRQTDRQTGELTGYPSIDKPWERGKSLFQKHPIIPAVNIFTLIRIINRKNLDKPAITCHEKTFTYRRMFEDSIQLANAMTLNAIKKGDIVTACLPNIYEAVVVFLACNRIGAIFTCVNANASVSEIKNYICFYESPILFTHRDDVINALKDNTNVQCVFISDKAGDKSDLKNTMRYSSFLLQGKPTWKGGYIFNSKDDAMILYTSGTTGKPKSVVLTNENVIASIIYEKNTATDFDVVGTKTLTCVPFAYPYGLITSLVTSLLWEKESILAPYIGIDTVEYYLSFKPNIIFGSPALLNVVMKGVPNRMDLSFVTMFVSGGDFLTIDQAKRGNDFFTQHGSTVEIGNGFGNAETVSNGTTPVGVKSYPNTVGKVITGTHVMIVDPETYEEKRYGEEGLMLATGKHIFREYYKDPEHTKESKVTINGREYFITGTMGFLDENGYFTLTGRQSRFYINSSLNKIYLDHVQKIIGELDCVDTCAVVKVADEKELYVNKVFIVLNKGFEANDEMKENIIQQLQSEREEDAETLKSHEIPKFIEFIDELPLIEGSEKVDYRKLEESCLS